MSVKPVKKSVDKKPVVKGGERRGCYQSWEKSEFYYYEQCPSAGYQSFSEGEGTFKYLPESSG